MLLVPCLRKLRMQVGGEGSMFNLDDSLLICSAFLFLVLLIGRHKG